MERTVDLPEDSCAWERHGVAASARKVRRLTRICTCRCEGRVWPSIPTRAKARQAPPRVHRSPALCKPSQGAALGAQAQGATPAAQYGSVSALMDADTPCGVDR